LLVVLRNESGVLTLEAAILADASKAAGAGGIFEAELMDLSRKLWQYHGAIEELNAWPKLAVNV
jgi:hypothetical protein